MVQIKGSLTNHSRDKEAAHPVRTVPPNMPASRDIAVLMPSLRTHSHLAYIQKETRPTGQDSPGTGQAKQVHTCNPAVQEQDGQLYRTLCLCIRCSQHQKHFRRPSAAYGSMQYFYMKPSDI